VARHKAKRRPFYQVAGACNCALCTEREQLHVAAYVAPEFPCRVVAMNFIGWMMQIEQGQYGGVSLENCFD
jgi:hypothetical protein